MKFELTAKVVGLILVVIGIWMAMDAILLAFNIPDYQKMYHALKIPNEYRQLMQGFDNFERILWKSVFFILVFESMIPILLGSYLMKPNNMFSDFSYPSVEQIDCEPVQGDMYGFRLNAEDHDYKQFSL